MFIYLSISDLCKICFFSGTAVTSLIAVLALLIIWMKRR